MRTGPIALLFLLSFHTSFSRSTHRHENMKNIKDLLSKSNLWLAIGLTLFLFSNGRWVISLFSWFAFVFLIRFQRTSSCPVLSILALWIGLSACYAVSFLASAPVAFQYYFFYAFCLLMGFLCVCPFIIDQIFYKRLEGFLSTLLWPLSMVTVSYFASTYMPSLAYSQFQSLSLMQIVSITGIGGLVFVIFWFASIFNWVWESDFDWKATRVGGSAFFAVLLLLLVYGQSRLAFASYYGETLPVALINVQRNKWNTSENFKPQDYEKLFSASSKAAQAGASAIAWAEGNAVVPCDFEDDFIELGKVFSKDNQVFLFMSYICHSKSQPHENKTIGISPKGNVVFRYLKSNLVPDLEVQSTRSGHGQIGIAEIDGIRTGHVICYDVDFPSYMQQTGKNDIDILFAPSSDWRGIGHFHATVARFRAIENGSSLVRPAIDGVSITTDPYGRILSYQDYYSSRNKLSIVEVPARRVSTFYARFGELFSISCIFALAALIGYAFFGNRNIDNTSVDAISKRLASQNPSSCSYPPRFRPWLISTLRSPPPKWIHPNNLDPRG